MKLHTCDEWGLVHIIQKGILKKWEKFAKETSEIKMDMKRFWDICHEFDSDFDDVLLILKSDLTEESKARLL